MVFNIKEDIENWLKSNNINDYIINEDMSVEVKGNVQISSNGLSEIPVKFRSVSGNFSCGNNDKSAC